MYATPKFCHLSGTVILSYLLFFLCIHPNDGYKVKIMSNEQVEMKWILRIQKSVHLNSSPF